MTYTCPRCGTWVTNLYIDTCGQHWICPKCQINSHSYTLCFDNKTHILKNEKGAENAKTDI